MFAHARSPRFNLQDFRVDLVCMFMAFFDMVLVIFMMVPASILCEAPTGYTDQGDCDPVESSSDLGSPDALSSEGLIAGSFTNNNNNGVADPLLVRIRDYKIVCEVAGLSKGKIRGISVITTYDCMGSVCGPLGVTRVTSQFNFYCNFPDLTLVIEEVGRNEHPIGTTETPLVTTCGRCASYNRARVTQALYYKNDTNCYRKFMTSVIIIKASLGIIIYVQSHSFHCK